MDGVVGRSSEETLQDGEMVEEGVTVQFDCGNCSCASGGRLSCRRYDCPQDCQLTQWTDWSPCSDTCGPGLQSRRRQLLRPAQPGGRNCDANDYQETRQCRLVDCPCHVGQWTEWGSCSVSCGGGLRERRRQKFGNCTGASVEKQTTSCNSAACPSATSAPPACQPPRAERNCSDVACPLTCEHVTGAAACSESHDCGAGGTGCFCASGTVLDQLSGACVRPRDCPCDLASVVCADCEEKRCVLGVATCAPAPNCDCQWGPWQQWGPCDKPCGGGQQTRERSPSVQRRGAGAACVGNDTESRTCNLRQCDVCVDSLRFDYWYRDGERMPAPTICEECHCHGQTTSRRCQPLPAEQLPAQRWSEWSEWTSCSGECGSRTRERRRVCIDDCKNVTGTARQCQPDQTGKSELDRQSCGQSAEVECRPVVDCVAEAEWRNSSCSAQCDGSSGEASGEMVQYRLVLKQPSNGGAGCPLTQRLVPCTKKCPVDCVAGDWQPWSDCVVDCGGLAQCDPTCGVGRRSRVRSVVVEAQNDGSQCSLREEQPCSLPCRNDTCQPPLVAQSCATRCRTTCDDLASDSGCEEVSCQPGCACTAGTYLQDGSCVRSSECKCRWDAQLLGPQPTSGLDAGGRAPAGHVVRRQCNNCTCEAGRWRCTDAECRRDCQLSEWRLAGDCNVTCGVGKQRRVRTVVQQPEFGGDACQQPLEDFVDCVGEEGRCCEANTAHHDTAGCEETCETLLSGAAASSPNCGVGCRCAAGFVRDVVGGRCVAKETCYQCVVGGVAYDEGFVQTDMKKCVRRTCVQGKFNETRIEPRHLPPCTNLEELFDVNDPDARRDPDYENCCYRGTLPVCKKVNVTIDKVFTPDGYLCEMVEKLQGSRCEGTCPSNCLVKPEVYAAMSEAEYDHMKRMHATLVGESVTTLCNCCHPTRESTDKPVQVHCKQIAGQPAIAPFFVNVKQVADCTCDRVYKT